MTAVLEVVIENCTGPASAMERCGSGGARDFTHIVRIGRIGESGFRLRLDDGDKLIALVE
jgi:hypothetical protein